jgi:hypothetical protein
VFRVNVNHPLNFLAPPFAALLLAGIILLGVTLTAVIAPGCAGPVSKTPCDYLQIARDALGHGRGFSPYFPVQVLDEGSSVYLQQSADPGLGFILHTPGVLIDRTSCRVCQVDGNDRYGTDHGRTVLASYPAERRLDGSVGWAGY